MEHHEVRILNGVTVATPRTKKQVVNIKSASEKVDKRRNKIPKKGTNNEEGD